MPESRGDAFSTGGRHPITPVSSTEGIIWIETRFVIKEAKPVSVHLLPGSPSPTPDPLPPLTGSIWHATGTDAGAAPDASLVQAEPLTPARRVSQDFGSAPIVPSLSLCSHFAWVLTETWCMPFTSGHDCRAGADVHESSSSGRASARYISAMAYASVAATLGILFSLFPAGLDGSGLGSANSWLARHFSCEAEVFTHAHP